MSPQVGSLFHYARASVQANGNSDDP